MHQVELLADVDRLAPGLFSIQQEQHKSQSKLHSFTWMSFASVYCCIDAGIPLGYAGSRAICDGGV